VTAWYVPRGHSGEFQKKIPIKKKKIFDICFDSFHLKKFGAKIDTASKSPTRNPLFKKEKAKACFGLWITHRFSREYV
jgi:hypothetical protein